MTAAASPTVGNNVAGEVRGLRINALAGLVMLLLEYGLGVWTNLYAHLPASDHGKATFAAFGGAVAHGPVGLALHALLGTLLIVTAIFVVVRAALVHRAAPIVLACVGLIAVLAAWSSGTKFVGDGANGASFGMAIATGVAILAYATILFIAIPTQNGVGPVQPARRQTPGRSRAARPPRRRCRRGARQASVDCGWMCSWTPHWTVDVHKNVHTNVRS